MPESLPAAPAPPAKAPKKPKPAPDALFLPVLAEFIFLLVAFTLAIALLATLLAAWLSGATLWQMILRGGVAVLVIGGLLLLWARQAAVEVLRISEAEVEQERIKAATAADQDTSNQAKK
jgi:sterol desaturase/sphingolipid hydroxylase (fatty acid hydroxylase superfamily)